MGAAFRAAANPVARAVKPADNAEKMDVSRIPYSTEKDFSLVKEEEQVGSLQFSTNVTD